MKTGKKLRGFFSLILVFSLVMGLIVSPIRQEYAGAAGPFPGLFRVAMVRGPGLDTNVEMLDIQRQSSRHSKNVNLNFKGSFSLYKVPKDVILYEDAKEYFTEENRLYCIEALGHQEFINPNPDFLEDDIKARPDDYHDIFEENPQVAEKLKDMFGTRAKDWERAGRGMTYSNLMGMQAEFAQYIFYFASKQAKHSDWIKYPKEASYKTTQIDKDNLESVSLYNGNKEAVRILVESELMKLRADVRAGKMEKIVKAPGSYAFDPIEGYAISGMTAESQNPEIKIDERFTKPLSREDMKKSDEAYRLEFEIGENLPNGTYKIQVKRMDLRGKPEWTYYSSYNYDLENSGQFLGSYNMDVGEIVDEFVIKYENPNLPPATAQVDENTSDQGGGTEEDNKSESQPNNDASNHEESQPDNDTPNHEESKPNNDASNHEESQPDNDTPNHEESKPNNDTSNHEEKKAGNESSDNKEKKPDNDISHHDESQPNNVTSNNEESKAYTSHQNNDEKKPETEVPKKDEKISGQKLAEKPDSLDEEKGVIEKKEVDKRENSDSKNYNDKKIIKADSKGESGEEKTDLSVKNKDQAPKKTGTLKTSNKIKKGSSPKTGDIIRSRIWMGVACSSGLGLLLTEIYCRKVDNKSYKKRKKSFSKL